MIKSSNRLHPVAPGFDAILRAPDYTRFPTWYDATTRLDGKPKR